GTFDGTLVFVSHNRSLIRSLATRIWNVEDQRVEPYPGTLDESLHSMAERRHAVATEDDKPKRDRSAWRGPTGGAIPQKAAVSRDDDKQRKRREAELRQKRSAKLGPLEKLVAQLEERISVL